MRTRLDFHVDRLRKQERAIKLTQDFIVTFSRPVAHRYDNARSEACHEPTAFAHPGLLPFMYIRWSQRDSNR
jgi:hypothetical protein